MNKKYELTDDTRIVRFKDEDIVLHRIRALRDIVIHQGSKEILIKAGDLGGIVQSEENLSQDGDCWIDDRSLVYEDAVVMDNAFISNTVAYDHAIIRDNARVSECQVYGAKVSIGGHCLVEKSKILDYALVDGDAYIHGSTISGRAKVYGFAKILKRSLITNHGKVFGYATIIDNCVVKDHATVCGDSFILNNSVIAGLSIIKGNSKIIEGSLICGDVSISGNSIIYNQYRLIRDRTDGNTEEYYSVVFPDIYND